MRLVFEKCLTGLARWARRRLELLGVRVEVCRYTADFQIERYIRDLAKREAVLLVTPDNDFWHLEREGLAVILNQPIKYEKALTRILKAVHRARAMSKPARV